MWLVVGLGNPEIKYEKTRHNIGFMVIDHFKQHLSLSNVVTKQECKAQTYHIRLNDRHLILCKPLTYMNLSGLAVKALMAYYKIPLDSLLVVHDDLDLPFGVCKFQKNRGAALHNGVSHIHTELGSQNYMRLRLGIGHPEGHLTTKNYVLSPFTADEQNKLPEWMDHVTKGIEGIFKIGFEKVASQYNLKKSLW